MAAIVALLQADLLRFVGLLGFGLIVLGLAYIPPVRRAVVRRRQRRHTSGVARQAFTELQGLVQELGWFVAGERSDSLEGVLQETFRDRTNLSVILDYHEGYWIRSLVYELLRRLKQDPPDFLHLDRAYGEFHTILTSYNDQNISYIYARLPVTMNPFLTPKDKSALEAFRERYVTFLDRYSEFSKRAAAQLPAGTFHPLPVDRPKPLAIDPNIP